MFEQRRRRLYCTWVVWGLLVLCALPTEALADEGKTDGSALRRRIAGSYYFQSTVENPFEFSFRGAMTFTRDGTFVADTANRNVPPSPGTDFSTNLGAWTLVDAKSRRARVRFLAFESAGGMPLFTHRVTLLVEFDRTFQEYQGTFVLEALLPEQDPLDPNESGFTATGSISARRIAP